MSRRVLGALIATLATSAPAYAEDGAATRVPVRVDEVAGRQAYLSPGADAGLAPGDAVELGGRRFAIVEVSATHALVVVDDAAVAEGDQGSALVRPGGAGADQRLAAPAPLAHFAGKWDAPRLPAASQAPRAAPLRRVAAQGPLTLSLSAHAWAVAPRRGPSVGELALGTELSVEPWAERPFGVDADATAYAWWGVEPSPVGVTDEHVRVRELRLRYGGEANPYAALGRLRWAARGVGLLDGVRVRVPVAGGLSLAAFGGFVPDPLSGAPASDASRFGAEVSWDPQGWAARPHLDASASGSIFDGGLDERRVELGAALAPGALTVDARAELSFFPDDNPWGAAALELTAAGADLAYRADELHAGVHLDLRQPERSRYLESLLPSGWLCTAAPRPPGTPEPCDGKRALRLSGALDAGFERGQLAVSLGASAIAPEGDLDGLLGGHGDVRLMGRSWHAALGGMALTGDSADLAALRLELGTHMPALGADASLFYRIGLLDYVAALEAFVQHRVGIDLAWTVSADVDLALQVEAERGPDLEAMTAIATAVWRPFR